MPTPDPTGRAAEAAAQVPSGAAMVCLAVPAELAQALAVDGGLPADQLHVTLAYLGQDLTDDQRDAAAQTVADVAAAHPPLQGVIGGLGRFPAGDSGTPVYAPVDVPGLAELRQLLVDALAAAGITPNTDHGWAPHMTLTYLPDDTAAAPDPVPATPVRFDALTWAQADDWQHHPFQEGEPVSTTEAVRLGGRIVEARGTNETGGRVYEVRLIEYGDSRNRRRYPRPVMESAARMYEGAKAYDHHRTPEEIATSTITGLVGSFRAVTAKDDGLYAELHLLPGAAHAAEALDAALAAQADGRPPLVGLSHDVLAHYRPIPGPDGRPLQEATQIVGVQSVDIVADPAAGGAPTRMLAGGTENTDPAGDTPDVPEESSVTKEEILALLSSLTPEELAAVGLSKATPPDDGGGTQQAAEGGTATAATESVQRGTEAAGYPKTDFVAQMMVRHKIEQAGLPLRLVESVTKSLPDLVTEQAVDAHITAIKESIADLEVAGLVTTTPAVGGARVTGDAMDKKRDAVYAMMDGKSGGYASLREAFQDYTGQRERFLDTEDFNRVVLKESFGGGYDSGVVRGTESMTSASWSKVLGDSMTRRMIAAYEIPALQQWRRLVSHIESVADFRQQKRERVGGYGVLPTVAEGAPYQPLTSPSDEEAVYQIIKRGGTEDVTLEMIANDDLRKIREIPRALGVAAGVTLLRFVLDVLPNNAATTYDATALFHTNHANTASGALNQTNLSIARRKMRQQAAFGASTQILSLTPKILWVPSALEEIAFQLCTSAVAVPGTPAGPSDTPNLHRGLDYEVVDYWTDADDWYLQADPAMCPTIEIGFYQGKQKPEIFSQSDGNSGAVFNADKYTTKIRHAYDLAVLDHRGLQRGTN